MDFHLLTPTESVSISKTEISKVNKNDFCMGTQKNPIANASWACFEKGTVWFCPPIDWILSTHVLSINCKYEKLQKD